MNALTTTNAAAAMVPRNMQDAMEMANMMARTGFLPKEIQNPGGALFVMEQSMRWNMSPFAVAMETSFIQGKPMFSGKIVGAAVQASGALEGRLSYEYHGSGDDRTVIVRGTLRGETTPREVMVRVRDVKTANRVWQTQTDQQLAYHGNRVWARRHAPEVMLGVYSPEEFEPAEQAAPREVPNMAHEPAPAPLAIERDKPFTFGFLEDQLSQFGSMDDIKGYLDQPKVKAAYWRAVDRGTGDKWSAIVQKHIARVCPEEREPGDDEGERDISEEAAQ